jgi:RES domain-containing protein
MTIRKRRAAKRPPPATSVLLDRFTEEQLDDWSRGGDILQGLADKVYFELERQRASKYTELCDALRSSPSIPVDVSHWCRVTDWQWNLTPLSPAGSIKDIGGRFNIGATLDRARGQAFPCVYIAENVETAYAEYFGNPLSTPVGPLALNEFALRRETSFATFLLKGQIDTVLDLRDERSLLAFVQVIRNFDISSQTKAAIRSVGLPRREIIRTPKQLRKRLLQDPDVWRQEPTLFAIPSVSQIFGRFVRDADFEGVLYPSQRGNGLCLAIFTENLSRGDSTIQVIGDVPAGASYTILNKHHA